MKEKWLGWIRIKFDIFSDGAGGLIYKPFSFYQIVKNDVHTAYGVRLGRQFT